MMRQKVLRLFLAAVLLQVRPERPDRREDLGLRAVLVSREHQGRLVSMGPRERMVSLVMSQPTPMGQR